MENVKKDPRFSHISKDPRFHRMPKHERKVKIDKRFKDMFSDKKFKLKYSVDKRGRPANTTTNENLKKFYELSESDDEDSSSEENGSECYDEEEKKDTKCIDKKEKWKKEKSKTVKEGMKECKLKEENVSYSKSEKKQKIKKVEKNKEPEVSSSEEELSDEDQSHIEEDEEDFEENDNESGIESGPDLARGEGNIESSSSEEDAGDESEEEGDELVHGWAELDKNVSEAKELGHRLAVCNMDWDCIKAQDIFLLLQSFVPTGGLIKSVKIYPSEFGQERMKEEQVLGPLELVKDSNVKSSKGNNSRKKSSDEFDAEDDEGGTYHREKLRQYQLNRLKYYYAVVDTDSIETANKIYEDCDGMEYESSATRLDLRFIPDDMTFDQEVKSECFGVQGSYKPNLFQNSALAQSKVNLTWDETDRDRLKVTMRNPNLGKGKNKEELTEEDMKAYLASSSDEEGTSYGNLDISGDDASEDNQSDNEESHISKYKQLVQSLADSQEDKNKKEVQMEISWEPGLRETTEKIVKKKEKGKNKTPWEEYLMKKKEKKRQKREERLKERHDAKKIEENNGEGEKDEIEAFSDDDIPEGVNMNDPFFSQLHSDEETPTKSSKAKKGKKQKGKKGKRKEEVEEEDNSEKAELALLMMDENEDNKQHFNLKSLMKKEKKKAKKKKNANLEEKNDQDDFKMDVTDPRFSALYESHMFNIDPSAKEFKKTKGMEDLVQEKIKRRTTDTNSGSKKKRKTDFRDSDKNIEKTSNLPNKGTDSSLASLINSVKNKTKNFKSKRK